MAIPFLKTLLSGSNFIKEIFDGVDKLTTTKEEKEQVKLLIQQNLLEMEHLAENELTERHKNDMASDSFLSKNIRPMVLIFILVAYTFMTALDGNVGEVQFNDSYVNLLGNWGMLVMSFYFGSRGIEKVMQIIENNKSKRESK